MSKRLLRVYFIGLVLFFSIEFGVAAPYFGQTMAFEQPDGSEVSLRLWGDEYFMTAETTEGHTVIRDETTGWICYAERGADGDIQSSGVPYKEGSSSLSFSSLSNAAVANSKGLNVSSSLRAKRARERRLALLGEEGITSVEESTALPSSSPSRINRAGFLSDAPMPNRRDGSEYRGTVKGLVIFVDFPDVPATYSLDEYREKVNKANHYDSRGEALSLRTFYEDVSNGTMIMDNVVYGIHRASNTFEYYDSLNYASGAKLLLEEVLTKMEAEGFDFSQLSVDSSGRIRSLCISYTGKPAGWAKGMWYHAGYWNGFQADGVRTGSYCTDNARTLSPSTLIHENGHMVADWPDTYSYNGIMSIPSWGQMGGGRTELPNPYFLYINSWLEGQNLFGKSGRFTMDSTDPFFAYFYHDPDHPLESFVITPYVKNLMYCSGIPDEGLSIWRHNEYGRNPSFPYNEPRIELISANNDRFDNRTKMLFSSGRFDAFTPRTIPSTNWKLGNYTARESGLTIRNISSAGDTMSFDLGGEAVSKGGILREMFFDVAGDAVADLTASSKYPDNPDHVTVLASFESCTNHKDSHGARFRGYVRVPITGNYTFYIASDDASELLLSRDENPDNAARIAQVNDWTNEKQYDRFPEQKSAVQYLEEGTWYYIEALHKEGSGKDHLSVAWTGPGISSPTIISGAYLYPWQIYQGSGSVNRDRWTGISGSALDGLIEHADFPNSPNTREEIIKPSGGKSLGDNYGQRIYGYIHPPYTGEYTFYISSDDASEIWLSSDDQPANTTRVAYLTSSTGSSDFSKYDTQESAPISLVAGNKYYIEVLHKEGRGNDHCSVHWKGPGTHYNDSSFFVEGAFVSPFVSLSERLLVDLNAEELPLGTLRSWENKGTLCGDFTHQGSDPVVDVVDGVKAVTFDGDDQMRSIFTSPPSITGNNNFTIVYRVHNPTIAQMETVVQWSRRGGPNGSNAQFCYGSNESWGALSHWGAADMGFDGGVPRAGTWHDIAITFDGTTQKIYVDGQLNAEEAKTLNMHMGDRIYLGCADGLQSFFTGSIAALKIYNIDLSAERIAAMTVTQSFTSWMATHALSGEDMSPTADPENDGLSNLEEYAFGGNPSGIDADSILPFAVTTPSGDSTAMDYVYRRRKDDPALKYRLKTTTNLRDGSWVDLAETYETGTSSTGEASIENVTNRIPVVQQQQFIRLQIEQ